MRRSGSLHRVRGIAMKRNLDFKTQNYRIFAGHFIPFPIMKQTLLFGLLAVVFASCNSSTSPNSTPATRPGVGSSFILHQQVFDTVGRVIDESTDTVFLIA